MNQIGVTQDGKIAYAGLAKFHFQDGLPLSVIFDELQKRNSIPSWIHLYKEFEDNGMKHENIIRLLSEHIFESYGKDFRNVVIERLEYVYSDK